MDKPPRNLWGNGGRLLYLLIVLVAGGAAIYVGGLTVYRYGLIVRAYLGASVFYLSYLCFVRLERADGIPFEFPRDYKYIPFVFVLGVTLYWAGIQIADLVGYLLKAL